MKPSERAFEKSDSAQVGGGCGSFISGDLCPSCRREPQPFPPSAPRLRAPSSAAASARLQSAAGGASREGIGIGHLAPGTPGRPARSSPPARLPDVVILLVMASPGSLCLCRFQHLLSEKWEALHETAKDVFSPQGHGSRGHGLSIIAKISPRHGTSQLCPEGEKNERHMGPSVPGPSWLGSRGRGWAPWSGNCRGKAFGEAKAHSFRKVAHLCGSGAQFYSLGLSTQMPPLSPAPRPTGGSHHGDPDTCTQVAVLGQGCC